MLLQIDGVEVRERRIGSQWLITSDHVPGLYVAHADRETARKAVPEAVRMLRGMLERRPRSTASGG